MNIHAGPEPTTEDLIKIRDSVAYVGRMSDSLFCWGPFRLGIDGILSWIPGIGEIYSAGAAGFILVQGYRARVPLHTLLTCAALMGSRTVISAVPLAGPAAADFFTAHRWSARMVVQAINRRLPASEQTAPGPTPLWQRLSRGPVAI